MSYRKLAIHPLHSLLRSTLTRTAAGALGAAAPLMVLANPTGGQVVAGNASIGSAGANGVVVNQGSQRAVINWQQFSVGSGQYVQFVQPNSSSVVLNRVTGSNPSNIFGQILANGQVFLVNPNGVYFAPGASIDVQGLVASTLDLNNKDFMEGRYQFNSRAGSPDAGVINGGDIQIANGGYVVLAGDYAHNDGTITAQTGRVVLAAGNAATLMLDRNQLVSYVVDGKTLSRLAGVTNTGEITANGGIVVMTADVANDLTATAVNNSGLITAHSVSAHGGEIVLLADAGIENSGTLDASATDAGVKGGTVIVHATGGDTKLTPDSVINVFGKGADGGFIDVSGHEITIKGQIEGGKGAKLLLDPSTITIEGAGSANASNCSGCEGGVIHTNFIQHELNSGFDLTIVASNQIILGSGNHGAALPTSLTATGTGKLSLRIGTTSFNTVTGTGHRITSSIFDNGTPLDTTFSPTTGGSIDIRGMTINIAGGFVASASHGIVKVGKVVSTGGNIKLTGAQVTATGSLHAAGSVNIHADGSSGTLGHPTKISTGKIVSDTSSVFVEADQSGGHGKATINVGGISAANGSVHIDALGNSGGAATITVGGNVTARAISIRASGSGTNSQTKITVNGNLTAASSHNGSPNGVAINAREFGGGVSGPAIKINGNITADRSIDIGLSGSRAGTLSITAGKTLTADTEPCTGTDCRVSNITLNGGSGTVKDNGTLILNTDPFRPGNVIIDGGHITVGNITGPVVDIVASNTANSGGSITALAGTTISAREISVDLNASYGGAITLSNLTASSSKGPAGIVIKAESFNAGNNITVNGAITVSGKGNNKGFNSNSSAMPGFGVPVAGFLDIQASGSFAAAHTVKVNGPINVIGKAGAFNYSNNCSCESGPTSTLHAQGVGGMAVVNIQGSGSHGSVQLLGATTLKGTDAELRVQANTIKTGALTVAGSGHTTKLQFISSNSRGTFSSSNNAGRANVSLGGMSGSNAAVITTGDIKVSGKGSATVFMDGAAITAGNITVTATVATGKRTTHINSGNGSSLSNEGLGTNMPGLFGFQMQNGSFSAGRAGVLMAESHGSNHSNPNPGQSIKVGNITVTGVGEADVALAAGNVVAGSINATAAAGKMKGSFSSGGTVSHFSEKFNINGGEANVQIDTGYGSHTAITVNGNITATGPTAGVNLFGDVIKVSKGIAVTGKGGLASISDSRTGGSAFHSQFKGPGPITGISVGGTSTNNNAASINIGGTVSAKGPGVIGIAITGAKVTLGGLSASASNVATYKVVDTSGGVNDTFTAGSVAVLVFQSASGSVTGPATVNGNVTISAPHGNVALGTQLNATGQVKITAAGNIDASISGIATRINELGNVTGRSGSSHGPGIPSSGVPLKLKAAGVSMVAGGSIDLTSATATVSGIMQLVADKDIILSGVNLNVGTFIADASGTIHNGGAIGTINAGALAIVAGKDINLSSTDISVGSGVVSSISGDPNLLAGLAAAGLSPASTSPNATFIAGGNLTLGSFTLKGSYLYLQAKNISITGPVTTNKGTVVQISPIDPTDTVGVEDQPGTGAGFNISNSLLLSLFPSDTLVLGNGAQTGDITLGSNGNIDIGDSNLIIDTSGTVTGLENVISTGLISTLESLLASALAPPTPSEIDPNSNNNNNAAGGKHHELGSEDVTPNGTGGTISQDTGSGVCH